MKKLLISTCLIAASLIATAGKMNATLITYSGTVGGQSANATINATFGLNSLTIVASGMTANPTSVVQALSAIDFSVLGGLTGTLSSVSGQLITIAANKSFTNTVGTPIWAQSGPGFYTTAIGVGPSSPDHLLIGAPNGLNLYSNANGGIAGNGPHNPFVGQTLTLVYNITGATANSALASLELQFGTTASNEFRVNITNRIPPNEQGVPEPSTAVFALAGFGAIAFWRTRKK